MKEISAALELQQSRDTAAQGAQARIARQQAGKDAHYYRVQAECFKALAASTRFLAVQASRLRMAISYERLAKLAEGGADAETQIARRRGQLATLSSDDRQIASAALVKLSRTLCDITAALSRETREKMRGSRAQRPF